MSLFHRTYHARSETPYAVHFADLDSWSLELGPREDFPTALSVRPCANVAPGMAHVHSIHASFDIPDEAVSLNDPRLAARGLNSPRGSRELGRTVL